MATRKVTHLNYVPVYDTDVTIAFAAPGSIKVSVNPHYCLGVESAEELKTILDENGLGPVTIEMLPPVTGFQRFNYSKNVPHFRYSNGAMENAGFVAINWIPNRNGELALLYAAQEVTGTMDLVEAN